MIIEVKQILNDQSEHISYEILGISDCDDPNIYEKGYIYKETLSNDDKIYYIDIDTYLRKHEQDDGEYSDEVYDNQYRLVTFITQFIRDIELSKLI